MPGSIQSIGNISKKEKEQLISGRRRRNDSYQLFDQSSSLHKATMQPTTTLLTLCVYQCVVYSP